MGALSTSTFNWSGGTVNVATINASTAFDISMGGTLSSNLAGAGTLTKTGAGTLVLSGANTYTGGTFVSGGTLSLQNDNAAGTGTITTTGSVIDYGNGVNIGNAINIDSDTTQLQVLGWSAEQSGVISETGGARSLEKIGAGRLVLSGANTYTGATTISGGRLETITLRALGNNGAVIVNSGGELNVFNDLEIGSLAGGGSVSIASYFGGIYNLNTGGDGTDTEFFGTLFGGGSLTKTGAGTQILSGANTYTGSTNIDAGTLQVNGSLVGVVNVNNGGTLEGTGSVGSAGQLVNVLSGGTLAAGNSPRTLNIVGDLTLNAGSISEFELGANGVVNGASNDLVNVGGDLQLGGTLNIVAPVVSGSYRLFNVTGDLLAGTFDSINAGASTGTIFTNNPNQVNLLLTNGGQLVQFWDGADMAGNGTIDGGTGVWNATNNNWTTAPGSEINLPTQAQVSVFSGTAGAVNVAGTQNFEGLQFTTTGYELGGGTLNMVGNSAGNENASFINVDAGVSATVASQISGLGLDKLGAGELVLSGANSYTGATTISGGTLTASNLYALGDYSAVIVNSGSTLNPTSRVIIGSLAGDGAVTFTAAGNLTLGDDDTDTIFSGIISGNGYITKRGTGTLTLSGINTYTGGTSNYSGSTLSLQNSSAAGTGTLYLEDSVTDYANGVNIANQIMIGSNTPQLQVLTGSAEQSGTISEDEDPKTLEKIGAGELILSGVNTYRGATTISAGTLSLDGGAAIFDSGAVNIGANGTLNLNLSETIGAMNNTGIINLQNSSIGNNLSVNGNYSGTGTLKIDVNNANQADKIVVTGTVEIGGTLDVFTIDVEADYPLGDGFTYTIIENDGADAVTGTFASVTTNFAFLDPTIDAAGGDGNDVVLTLSSANPVPDFKPLANNPNQSTAAIAMDNFDYGSTDGQLVRGAVIGLTNTEAQEALTQFSGADHEASGGLGNIVSGAFRSIMMGRAGAGAGGTKSQPSTALGYAQTNEIKNETLDAINDLEIEKETFYAVWLKPFATYSKVDKGTSIADISAFNAGIAFGAEVSSSNIGLLGISGGYSASKFSTITAGATSKADNFYVGLYGLLGASATGESGWGFSGALDYTFNMFETRRPVTVGALNRTAAADYNGYSIGGEIKARYGFETDIFGSKSIFSPFAGVNFLSSKNNAYIETGAGSLNISAANVDNNRIASLIGFEVSNQAMVGEMPINSKFSIGWKHEFGDVNQINSFSLQGSPTQFLIASPKEARDKLVIDAGIDFTTSENSMLTLSTFVEASTTSLAYGASAAYKVKF